MTATTVPFADLSHQWRAIADDVAPDLRDLFESSAFCLGPWVERFERAYAAHVGARHAIGVNSGTSALHLALIAAGIGPGDHVLIPAQTFIATAWAALYVGAKPVLCDVDPVTGTIDIADAERRVAAIERRAGATARAIVPVHLFGQPADMTAVMAFAQRRGLAVIEDCAQSHGARFEGRMTGGFGQFAAYSFYPGKNLGAAGEAGMVTTDDDAAAERLRALRNHGQRQRYEHAELGFNYRMEGIQGLILGHKLRHLDAWTEARRAIARRYLDGLAGLPDLTLPETAPNRDHVHHLFVARTPARDALQRHLAEAGIQTGLHYPIPLNRQPALAGHVDDPNDYPRADLWANHCLSLPIYFGMAGADVERVIDAVRGFHHAGR